MIKNLVPAGLRGFMLAAIAGAIISTLASLINSASTIFTMDVFHRLIDRGASQARLVLVGRLVTVLAVAIGALLAPELADPRFGGVFNFIQNFQGYIWPGVVAAFVVGLLVPQAPAAAGVAALISGPAIYGLFQYFAASLHFLLQVALTFQLVLLVMGVITFFWPLATPKPLPERNDLNLETSPLVRNVGIGVIGLTVLFYVVFW
jgi:SSS family solute:Na+ symporter